MKTRMHFVTSDQVKVRSKQAALAEQAAGANRPQEP
jgi:hypothetical protein